MDKPIRYVKQILNYPKPSLLPYQWRKYLFMFGAIFLITIICQQKK